MSELTYAMRQVITRLLAEHGTPRDQAIDIARGAVDELCQQYHGTQYIPAPSRQAKHRAIAADCSAGKDPNAVARKHGVSVSTVKRLRQQHCDGFGRDGWNL